MLKLAPNVGNVDILMGVDRRCRFDQKGKVAFATWDPKPPPQEQDHGNSTRRNRQQSFSSPPQRAAMLAVCTIIQPSNRLQQGRWNSCMTALLARDQQDQFDKALVFIQNDLEFQVGTRLRRRRSSSSTTTTTTTTRRWKYFHESFSVCGVHP